MSYGPPQGYPPPGYPQQPYGYPPQPPPKKGLSGWLIAGIVALAVVGTCVGAVATAGKKSASDKKAAAAGKADAKSVTADELAQAYKDNEVGADEKYKGEWLRVSGTVDAIDSGIGDKPIVRLKGKEMFQSVMVNDLPKAEAGSLKKGQKLTVVCKGGGEIIGSPRLEDCEID